MTENLQPGEVEVSSQIPGIQPEPLRELSPDEATEWRQFTSRMPPDWFPPETWPMLAQLCRHICQARWVGQALQEVRAGLLDMTDDDAIDRLMKLQSLHDREGRAMLALMVRLRLTSQQRIPDADVADRARERGKDQPQTMPWMVPARPTKPAARVERRQ